MADIISTATATATATTTQTQLPPPTIQLKQSSADSLPPSGHDEGLDLSRLPAAEALRLLSANLETLVRVTGDVPPTPPPRTPTDPQMTGLQAEKDMMARASPARTPPPARRREDSESTTYASQHHHAIDGVHLKTPSSSSPSSSSAASGPSPDSSYPYPYPVLTASDAATSTQHGAITRRFYRKLEPPLSITGYLARLHQFCPASAAVYMAASLYIHRLAVEERAIPVTRRNAHRLVLAGVRVAAKALEDLAYPHAKVARVGGVSEAELARLEISFCFLAGFELVVREEKLRAHWEALREVDLGPVVRLGRAPRGRQGSGGERT